MRTISHSTRALFSPIRTANEGKDYKGGRSGRATDFFILLCCVKGKLANSISMGHPPPNYSYLSVQSSSTIMFKDLFCCYFNYNHGKRIFIFFLLYYYNYFLLQGSSKHLTISCESLSPVLNSRREKLSARASSQCSMASYGR